MEDPWLKDRKELTKKTISTQEFQESTGDQQAALILGNGGVVGGKISQMLSSDEDIAPELRSILSRSRSNCAPTRTIPEAQAEIDATYGDGKYTLKSHAGAGTVGEVYIGEMRDEKKVVVKMLKRGVSSDSIESERQGIEKLIRANYSDPSKQKYMVNRLNNLCDEWKKEVDFSAEAENANALNKYATKYKVATPVEQPKGNSMIQHAAEGVSVDKVIEMLNFHKNTPDEYAQKYAKEIRDNPWLQNPENWKNELPSLYRDSFNEQTLQVHGKEKVASHGDPHAGNVFVNHNTELNKLEITYIDAGLVSMRDPKKAIEDAAYCANTIIGNNKAIAKMMVSKASTIPDNVSKSELAKRIESDLNSGLDPSKFNVTASKYNSKLLDAILEKHGILLPSNEMTFMKANMQASTTYTEISQAAGIQSAKFMQASLPDIKAGLIQLAKQEPSLAASHAFSGLAHVIRHPMRSIENLYQFTAPQYISVT